MTDSQPFIYLIGDAGYDQLVVKDDVKSKKMPSGAFFLESMLRKLLDSKNFTISSLITNDTGKNDKSSCFDPLPQKKAILQQYDDDKVWRISSYNKANGEVSPGKLTLKCPSKEELVPKRLLIAHHAGESWSERTARQLSEFLTDFIEPQTMTENAPASCKLPDILVNVSGGFPDLKASTEDLQAGPFKSEVWNTLYQQRHRVGIILSVSTLQGEGGAIAHRLSWEQSIEDLTAELHLFPRLKALSWFRHLFVRFGMVGFLHIERCEGSPHANQLCGRVYFAPYAQDGIHRDPEREGFTIGRNTFFIAALAYEILRSQSGDTGAPEAQDTSVQRLRNVFMQSLTAMRAVDDNGYKELFSKPEELICDLAEQARDILFSAQNSVPPEPGSLDTLAWRPLPEHLLVAPPPNALRSAQKWYILDDLLLGAPVHRINVAMAIVKAGHERVLNRVWSASTNEDTVHKVDKEVWSLLTRVEYWNPWDRAPDYVTLEEGYRPATAAWPDGQRPTTRPVIGALDRPFELNVPVITFGELTLIERDESESLRGISNLLALYREQVRRGTANKPISIAVFGPPGSGKSFAVKQIAEAFPQLEFNVAQFRSIDDLTACFHDVHVAKGINKKTPLVVFFDEFDCTWEGSELGWLKYFLAPMQDGKFRFQNENMDIGPAIFVFAGGLHSRFEHFDPRTDTAYDNLRHSEEYEHRLKRFVDQKGPDFISRLRGHINVLEINNAPGRIKHFIRRAMQLRGLLKKNGHILEKGTLQGLAQISDAIIYALLTVDRYRHGVRSMQAIVEMCTPIYGKIDIASLPSRAQLNMHVDAEEFLIRVHRGLVRAQPDWLFNATEEIDSALRALEANTKRINQNHLGRLHQVLTDAETASHESTGAADLEIGLE